MLHQTFLECKGKIELFFFYFVSLPNGMGFNRQGQHLYIWVNLSFNKLFTHCSFLFRFLLLFPWGSEGCYHFYPPHWLLGPNPVDSMGEGQGTPWMSRQLIAGRLHTVFLHIFVPLDIFIILSFLIYSVFPVLASSYMSFCVSTPRGI